MSSWSRAWLLACVLGGCLNSPRTQGELSYKDAPVRFEGLVAQGSQPVAIEAYDFAAQRWQAFAELPVAATDGVTDTLLGSAYRFSGSTQLPSEARFWTATGANLPGLRARVRAVQAGATLRSFGAGADRCVESARQAGRSALEALDTCKAGDSPVVELRVPRCGGETESCCTHHGTSASGCEPALRCAKDRCQRPDYPVPLVPDLQADISIASGHSIRDAWLELDDRSSGEDSRLPLTTNFKPAPGVTLLMPHPNVARLRFDLPLWKAGANRFRVRGTTSRGGASSSFATPYREVSLELPHRFGLRGPGVLELPAEHYPRRPEDSSNRRCKDAEGDGLCDLWENVVLHQLRPLLRFDRGDTLFTKAQRGDAVRVLSSVSPWQRDGVEHVVLANVVTFSRDYGPLGFEHAGDTEGHGLVLRAEGDGSLRWAGSVAKGHGCLTCKPAWRWGAQDFGPNGEPEIFVEKDKHGLWSHGRSCRRRSPFACGANRSLRAPTVNVGDWSQSGARALVDELDHLSPFGPHAELSGVFPGEAVWSALKARVRGRFCGGRRSGCTRTQSANQPGAVIKQLVQVVQKSGYEPVL